MTTGFKKRGQDFPGGLVAKSGLPKQGAVVSSLQGDLDPIYSSRLMLKAT